MSIEWNDKQPIYKQLRCLVVERIMDGSFAEGDAVPSVGPEIIISLGDQSKRQACAYAEQRCQACNRNMRQVATIDPMTRELRGLRAKLPDTPLRLWLCPQGHGGTLV